MNGKGGTVTFTCPRLQLKALWSNPAPDHRSVLSSNQILFLMIFYAGLLYYFYLKSVC